MVWDEIQIRPEDEQRQKAVQMGVGGYGGEEQNVEVAGQGTELPKE